jgi:hypothetical protein
LSDRRAALLERFRSTALARIARQHRANAMFAA